MLDVVLDTSLCLSLSLNGHWRYWFYYPEFCLSKSRNYWLIIFAAAESIKRIFAVNEILIKVQNDGLLVEQSAPDHNASYKKRLNMEHIECRCWSTSVFNFTSKNYSLIGVHSLDKLDGNNVIPSCSEPRAVTINSFQCPIWAFILSGYLQNKFLFAICWHSSGFLLQSRFLTRHIYIFKTALLLKPYSFQSLSNLFSLILTSGLSF